VWQSAVPQSQTTRARAWNTGAPRALGVQLPCQFHGAYVLPPLCLLPLLRPVSLSLVDAAYSAQRVVVTRCILSSVY